MTLISIDQHKMTHWLDAGWQFGFFTVDADMIGPALVARPCYCLTMAEHKQRKCWALDGVRVNDLDVLPPWNHFRKEALRCARRFIDGMRTTSLEFIPVTAEADMLVFGPYHYREVEEFGKHKVRGRQEDENHHPDKLNFKIGCRFVQKYARATDPGPERPDWLRTYWDKVDADIAAREQPQLILATR